MIRNIAALTGLALLVAAPAAAETWQMPTPYADSLAVTRNVAQFAKDVEELTDGELTITLHTNASLIKHRDIKNAVRSGQVQIGELLMSILSNENPVYEIGSLPFQISSYADAKRLSENARALVEEDMERQGMKLLFINPWGTQGLYSADPIETVDDMQGAKFRAYNFATQRIAQLAGAVPTQVELADLPQAFNTGRVSMMITSVATGVSSSSWDFLNYFYNLQVSVAKDMIIVSQEAFDALSPDAQKGLLEAAKRAEPRGWKMAQADEAEKLKVLSDHGINVEPGSEALREGLRKIGKQMADEWKEDASPEAKAVLEAYQAGE